MKACGKNTCIPTTRQITPNSGPVTVGHCDRVCEDDGVRYNHLAAFFGGHDRRTSLNVGYVTFDTCDTDKITQSKGLLPQQENTRQKVLQNILERKAHGNGSNAEHFYQISRAERWRGDENRNEETHHHYRHVNESSEEQRHSLMSSSPLTHRRVSRFAREAPTRNSPKIKSAKIMFGKGEMISLRILLTVFHAMEKSHLILPNKSELRASPPSLGCRVQVFGGYRKHLNRNDYSEFCGAAEKPYLLRCSPCSILYEQNPRDSWQPGQLEICYGLRWYCSSSPEPRRL